jgi:hypothetical protein
VKGAHYHSNNKRPWEHNPDLEDESEDEEEKAKKKEVHPAA